MGAKPKRPAEGKDRGSRVKRKLAGRLRIRLLMMIGLTVAAGIASRRFPQYLPTAFGKYPGDVLWAMAVYWLMAFLAPKAPVSSVALRASVFSAAIEFSQLYRADWIRQIRGTTFGHFVLGSTFSARDLAAYAVGILLCLIVDKACPKLLRGPSRDIGGES